MLGRRRGGTPPPASADTPVIEVKGVVLGRGDHRSHAAPEPPLRSAAGPAAPDQPKLIDEYARSFHSWCSLLMLRIVPERERMTSE